jgi:hypothetical protein
LARQLKVVIPQYIQIHWVCLRAHQNQLAQARLIRYLGLPLAVIQMLTLYLELFLNKD